MGQIYYAAAGDADDYLHCGAGDRDLFVKTREDRLAVGLKSNAFAINCAGMTKIIAFYLYL
jgi:hypothetical protein